MSAPIPQRLNLILVIAIMSAWLAQMLVMPLVLAGHPWIMAAIVIVLLPLNTPFWSLIHEAIHKNLHSRVKINNALAQGLSIIFGASFDILRFGHLMHHQYNRDWESEIFDPERQHPAIAWLAHYSKMLGGLYLIEVIMSGLLALSPQALADKVLRRMFTDDRQQQAVLRALAKPEALRRIRLDCAAIVLLYAVVFTLFGANWWVAVLLIGGRALTISIMDNAYHYGTPADNSVIAKELQLPRLLALFVLNFNHHATHHRNTALPWTDLKSQHDAHAAEYTEGLAPAIIAQFKGPIRHT